MSADFAAHAVSFFFEPLLEALDRRCFETVCYSDVGVPDAVTARLRGKSDHWRDTARMSDEQLDALVRRDGIDVLLDLAGHTANNRLLVFARKPAPLQVTWLGYPNTTGLTAIDFRITDSSADPEGQTEPLHSEKLLRLTPTFLCFRPAPNSPPVNTLPALSESPLTFGSFSNLAKMGPGCNAVWAAILKRLPGARLLLKSAGLDDPVTVQRVRAQFQAHGVAAERLLVNGAVLPVYEHLALYHQVDVALDPFPYNGTTTTCEAMWMGVPVVALAGATHVSRVGVSLLNTVGLTQCIAPDTGAYVERAVALAANLTALARLRQELRSQMSASALCDAARFAAGFASAISRAWEMRAS